LAYLGYRGYATVMEFHSFRLDTVNQCLWRRRDTGDDERILLRPKAYGVLRYLVDHAGRLVTEAELLEAVWPGIYVQPEAVKSQLHEVRRALGDNPKAPLYIETLPKRGYQFIAPIRGGSTADLATLAKPAHGRLVGRDRSLAELRDCLRMASRGQRQIVFVTGEPGIGKTALVDEVQRAVSMEMPTICIARGQCIEGYGGKEAYYPVLEAVGQLCRGAGAGSLVETLAAQAPTWLVQFPALLKREHREALQQEILGATRERMLREIGMALETIAAEKLLLLVFEDLQWVDHSTVDLLSAIARRRTPARLMLIATYRSVDLALSDHPLKALRQDLLVHQLCREIDLEPLAEADVAEYLTTESSQVSPPEGLAELIYRHTEGNPLFMVAALDHLTQRGFIWRENGSWQLRVLLEEIDLEVPESLRQMIEAQIERLSAEEQRALEAASVAGAAFSARIAAADIDMGPEIFEDLCESLVRRHRIVRSAGSQEFPDGNISQRYEFVHALYREVFYQRQAPGRRTKLHRRIGERLEALFSQQMSEVAPELAHHFEQGSDWPRAVKYLRLAAETAARRYAQPEAAALLDHALALASKLPEAERAESETGILEKLAPIYLLSIDTRALETYEALATRAAHYGLIDVEVRALIEMAFLLSWANSQRALEVLDRAMARSAGQVDSFARTRSRMRCSYLRIWASAWNNEGAAVCGEALSEIRQAGDPFAIAPHLIDYSFLLFMCSEYRESHRIALEGLAVLTEGSKVNPCATVPQVNGSTWAYLDLLFLGEWGEALKEIEGIIAALTKNANDGWAQGLRFWRAWLSVFAMDYAGALGICESATRSLGDSVSPPDQRFYLAMAGTAEVGLGNHERGLEHLSLAIQEMDRQMVMNDWHCRLVVESALTELRLAKGDIVHARAQAERFLQAALATAERTYQAFAWEVNARVAMAESDLARAQDCIAKALSTMEGFEVPLAAWRVHATATELYTLVGNKKSAEHQRELSHATILKLANSLPAEHSLRKTFLSAPSVSKILASR
jgi:DNA-binding winged helix-turn-helix (wHTH) protein